jgi:hypothetical protein
VCLAAIFGFAPVGLQAQDANDPVIRRIWQEGVERSQTERFAQVLTDSIGPRLSGTEGFAAAVEWLLRTYAVLQIPARKEQYGTWRGWQRGPLHVDLLAPWVGTLEARFAAWSPGTNGPVEGEVVALPPAATDAEATAWLASVRGKYVLLTAPRPMCRAPQELVRYARPETVERNAREIEARLADWSRRIALLGGQALVGARLEAAGALGVLSSHWIGGNWEAGWGVTKVVDSYTQRVPSIELSCEDYGLLARLAERGQGPRLRVDARAAFPGDVPMFNVIAELRGAELPGEYVILSAHLDSEQGATGATDNGTGTVAMLEAMRLLALAYPRPRRTILAGHWGGEEQGLNGSRAFVEDHPDVVAGLQALFNNDNGTWRVELIEGMGFARAGDHIGRWMQRVPESIGAGVSLVFPGPQENLGSDHSAFVCHGAPGFRLQSDYEEYRQYTWHTNRDTFDKIVLDDLRQTATLAAMLAYAAAEDTARVPRERAVLPIDPRTGQPRGWPRCGTARRTY